MKIAIPTEDKYVCEHFGRSPEFTIFTVENEKIIKKEVITNPGHSTGFLPKFFHELGVNTIITGGAGWRAQQFFSQYRIKFILGITGQIDDVIENYVKGNLKSKESLCSPGKGKGYGIEKEDKEEKKWSMT